MPYHPFTPPNAESAGWLDHHMEGFARYLRESGYRPWTAGCYLLTASSLSRWLFARRVGRSALTSQKLEEFLAGRARVRRPRSEDRSSLQRLVEFLQLQGALSEDALARLRIDGTRSTGGEHLPLAERPIDAHLNPIERQYERHLAEGRGLAASTRQNYLRIVAPFLSSRSISAPGDLRRLSPDNVTAYVLRLVRGRGRASGTVIVSALRGFLRFAYSRRYTRTDLAACIPAVPCWRLRNVPKYLAAGDVRRLLRSCDRRTTPGRRDFAVLLLLARLGFRSGEIVRLTLEDVDWRAGEILVRGKGGHESRLPLPRDVGRALADYLRRDRPRCPSRRIFIRAQAPWTGFANQQSVSNIVRRAIARAGLSTVHRGAHLLRHTLATRLLNQRASLFEIGQILGHRHPDTTAIYAKADIGRLRELAAAMPGRKT